MDGTNTFFTSVICIAEFQVGLSQRRSGLLSELKEVFEPLSVTYEIARAAGRLRQEFLASGFNIALPDHLIAATVLQHNLTLVTFNKKDFPHKGLKLYPAD